LTTPIQYRCARLADADLLARLNRQLIRDEGHRNSMTDDELERRMEGWLAGEYQAVVFEDAAEVVGYALFRRDEDFVYVRQFYVVAERRRQGVGRAAIEWLAATAWAKAPRIRIEVLVGNLPAIEFWRALGFVDYSITMEREVQKQQECQGEP
jgi:GNAT superfamily N-acetyltransferase